MSILILNFRELKERNKSVRFEKKFDRDDEKNIEVSTKTVRSKNSFTFNISVIEY